MKHRITALFLALSLTVSLSACSGGQAPEEDNLDPSPDVTQAVTFAPDAAPDTAPDPDPGVTALPDKGTPPPDATHHPDDHHPEDAPPVVTHHPDDHHSPTAQPSATPEPTPEPDPSEPTQVITADFLYKAWLCTSSQSDAGANLSDMSSLLENYYDLSASDLEDYVLYMPAMSSSMEEVFIAKAKSGKVSAVKAACQTRLDDLKEDADLYPATAGNLDSAKLETSGDWVVLAVCATPGNLVKIVQTAAN